MLNCSEKPVMITGESFLVGASKIIDVPSYIRCPLSVDALHAALNLETSALRDLLAEEEIKARPRPACAAEDALRCMCCLYVRYGFHIGELRGRILIHIRPRVIPGLISIFIIIRQSICGNLGGR